MRVLPLITGTETAGPWKIRQTNRAVYVISSFQIAESMGLKGDFRQWEDYCGSEIENRKAYSGQRKGSNAGI